MLGLQRSTLHRLEQLLVLYADDHSPLNVLRRRLVQVCLGACSRVIGIVVLLSEVE